MNKDIKNKSAHGGILDGVLWLLALCLVAVGVYGNSAFGHDYPLVERVAALIVLAVVASVILLLSSQGKAFLKLVKESRTEIRRVIWPTRQETTQTSLIVIVVVLIAALILWGLDSLLGLLARWVIG